MRTRMAGQAITRPGLFNNVVSYDPTNLTPQQLKFVGWEDQAHADHNSEQYKAFLAYKSKIYAEQGWDAAEAWRKENSKKFAKDEYFDFATGQRTNTPVDHSQYDYQNIIDDSNHKRQVEVKTNRRNRRRQRDKESMEKRGLEYKPYGKYASGNYESSDDGAVSAFGSYSNDDASSYSVETGDNETMSPREITRARIVGGFQNREKPQGLRPPVTWTDRDGNVRTKRFNTKEEAAAGIDKQAQKQAARMAPGHAESKAHNRRMVKDPDYAARVREAVANGGSRHDVKNDAWNGDWYDYEY